MSLLGISTLRRAEEAGRCITSRRRSRSIMNGVPPQRQTCLKNIYTVDELLLRFDEEKDERLSSDATSDSK